MKKQAIVRIFAALLAVSCGLWNAGDCAWAVPATHYVSPGGDDSRDGLTPERAWRTLSRVNTATLAPGDKILFQRGGQWRGQLMPQSGSAAAPVTYGAYGEGPKPALLGSAALNDTDDWKPAGPNRWITTTPAPTGKSILTAERLRHWALHCEQGAAAQGHRSSADYTVRCVRAGASGSHLQLFLSPFPIENGKTYMLRFRARATKPFDLLAPHLMSSSAPWLPYSAAVSRAKFAVGTDWIECRQLYQATRTATNGRLTFFLGGGLPAGAELTLADLTLEPCKGDDLLSCDVGNIIFDGGAAWGIKKWGTRELQSDLDYWYDPQGHTVTLQSTEHPARRFKAIELALNKHIINQSNRHWIVYENIDIRYGAAHGIGGASTHHITVRDCDFSWIGGGHQLTRPNGTPVRFGNGVEFWANAHDCLVERCRLWEIYDAALTNQSHDANCRQFNIVYRNNLIWNSEYSFEYWNNPESAMTRNVVFEHNTCYGAGYGWGHAQRPNPAGRHLCFYSNRAQTQGLVIRDNIFCEATDFAIDALWWNPEKLADSRVILLERNCWFQPKGAMMRIKGKVYTQAQFEEWQRDMGQDAHSLAADPRLVDPRSRDFRLRPDSPCIGLGAHLDPK